MDMLAFVYYTQKWGRIQWGDREGDVVFGHFEGCVAIVGFGLRSV